LSTPTIVRTGLAVKADRHVAQAAGRPIHELVAQTDAPPPHHLSRPGGEVGRGGVGTDRPILTTHDGAERTAAVRGDDEFVELVTRNVARDCRRGHHAAIDRRHRADACPVQGAEELGDPSVGAERRKIQGAVTTETASEHARGRGHHSGSADHVGGRPEPSALGAVIDKQSPVAPGHEQVREWVVVDGRARPRGLRQRYRRHASRDRQALSHVALNAVERVHGEHRDADGRAGRDKRVAIDEGACERDRPGRRPDLDTLHERGLIGVEQGDIARALIGDREQGGELVAVDDLDRGHRGRGRTHRHAAGRREMTTLTGRAKTSAFAARSATATPWSMAATATGSTRGIGTARDPVNPRSP
jgi:hypothetical protein